MRPAGDPEDLARGQLPVLLVGAVARALLELAELAAERGEVLLLGHLPGLAQPLEEVAQGRPPGEPDGVDLHEVGQRRVEEAEPPVLVEDREPDRQVGEGLGQGLDEAPERRLGGDEVVGVEREAEALAGRPRALADLVPARLGVSAAGHRHPPPAVGAARGQRDLLDDVAEGVGDAVVGQLARGCVEAVAVGGVRPGDLAVGPVAPGEHRRPVEHVAQEAQLGAGAVERRLGVLERARLLARRADRQVGGAAARLAEDLEGGAVAARAVVAESGAVEHQRLEVGLQARAVGGEVRRERGEPRPARRQAGEQRPRRLVQRLQARAADQVVAGPRGPRLGRRRPPSGGQARREARDQRQGRDRADQRREETLGQLEPARERRPAGEGKARQIHRVGPEENSGASEATRFKEGLTLRALQPPEGATVGPAGNGRLRAPPATGSARSLPATARGRARCATTRR